MAQRRLSAAVRCRLRSLRVNNMNDLGIMQSDQINAQRFLMDLPFGKK
jgi:hypothetical protein